MKKIVATLLIMAITGEPVLASGCSQIVQSFGQACYPQERIIRSRVVQKAYNVIEKPVYVEKVQKVLHYFVGAPAGVGYEPLQEAQYGQLERMQRQITDRLSEMKAQQLQYQQRVQSYQTYQVPQQQPVYQQQYQQPAQQPYAMPYQAPQAMCQSCQNPLLQQPQQAYQQGYIQPQTGQAYGQPYNQRLAPQGQQTAQAQGYGYSQANGQLPQGQAPPLPQNVLAGIPPQVLVQNCARCHTGANPKGDFDISRVPELPLEDRQHVFEMAASGKMPPPKDGARLNDEKLGQLAREIFTPDELGQMFRSPPEAAELPANGAANGAANGTISQPQLEAPAEQHNGTNSNY